MTPRQPKGASNAEHRPAPAKPTDAELEILQVLWRKGTCAVGDVLAELPRKVGYTTVLKLLQIMLRKGLVRRDESTRRHTYEAALERSRAQDRLLSELLGGMFGGSPSLLLQRALDTHPASEAELREIEELIASARSKRRGSRDAPLENDARSTDEAKEKL